ncbi:MAG TPA: MFS transporter [Ilumatobacter sp.]|nr:MFS transporter [Ilumatobacter sp.]
MTTITHSPHQHRPGSIRAAWSYPAFRLFFMGTGLSAVGSWMQSFTLPAYVDDRTGSAGLVGLLFFMQLGPQLLLSLPAGVLADRVDRRRLMIAMQLTMLALSVVIAFAVWRDLPLWTLFVLQALIGIANTVNSPALSSAMPMLVGRADLPGAISLNSAMLNGSRILGPALAALLAWWGFGVAGLLLVNAGTFLFLIFPLLVVDLPRTTSVTQDRSPFRALVTGLGIARRRAVLRRSMIAMSLFSIISLPYVGLFPSIARMNWDVAATSGTYKAVYIVWGLGAFAGALSVGSIFRAIDKRRLVQLGFVAFSVSLATFALVPSVDWAYPVGAVLGFSYFVVATSLASLVQQNLADNERAATMPVWFMSFGGSVPVGLVIAGPIMDAYGATAVLLVGAGFALALAGWIGLDKLTANDFLPVDMGGEQFRPVGPFGLPSTVN